MRRNPMGSARLAAFAGLALTTQLLLGACAADSSSGDEPAPPSAGAAAITADDVELASTYVGGSPGAADPAEAPITIGLIANVEGATAQPYLATTAENAADFVNTRLGGVAGGHPLQFVRCTFGGSAEQGQLCGQRFANDPSVKFVLFPGGTTGSPQMHAANNGAKAYLCTVASPADANVVGNFCTSGGPLAGGSMITYLKDYVKARTVSLITPDEPTLSAIVKQQAAAFKAVGIETTIGLAPAGATDVTQTVLAAGTRSTDATMLLLPNDVTCIPFVKAFVSLGITKPTVALPGCGEDSVKAATGDFPKFTFYEYGPDPRSSDPQVSAYRHVMGAYGTKVGANGPQVFGSALLVARLINELGADNLTTAAVSQKLAAFTGPAFLGDEAQSFGNQPFTSVGSLRARFYTYEGDGKWVDATEGKWLVAPGR